MKKLKKLKKWLIITPICFISLYSNIIFADNLPRDLKVGGKYSYVNQTLTKYLSLHPEDSDKYMVKYAISKKALDKWKEDIDASGQNKSGDFDFLTGEHAWAPAFIIEKSDNSTLAENVTEEADKIINAGMFTHIIETKKSALIRQFKNKYEKSLQQMSSYVYDYLAFEFIALNTQEPKTQMVLLVHPETYKPLIYVFKQQRHFQYDREYKYTSTWKMWHKKINETLGRKQIINQIECSRNRKITPSQKLTISQSATGQKVIVVVPPKRKIEEHPTLNVDVNNNSAAIPESPEEYKVDVNNNSSATPSSSKPTASQSATGQKQQKAKASSSSYNPQNSTSKLITSYFVPFENNNTKSSPEEDKVDVNNNSVAIPESPEEYKVDGNNNSSATPPSPKKRKVDVDNSIPETKQKKKQQPTKTNNQWPIQWRNDPPPKKRKHKNKQDGSSQKKQSTLPQFMK